MSRIRYLRNGKKQRYDPNLPSSLQFPLNPFLYIFLTINSYVSEHTRTSTKIQEKRAMVAPREVCTLSSS